MIESSLDALVAINPEGMFTDDNEATVRSPASLAEFIQTRVLQLLHEPLKADRIFQQAVRRSGIEPIRVVNTTNRSCRANVRP